MTLHPIERARQRYGLDLGPADLCLMIEDIAAGRSVLLKRQRGGGEIHLVRAGNTAVLAVYAPAIARIVTILPPGRRKGGR